MGQACSCRQPRGRKLQRRSSDASLDLVRRPGGPAGSDDDSSDEGQEIDILIDGDMERDALLASSSSSAAARATAGATVTKRTSKSQQRDDNVLSRRASASVLSGSVPSATTTPGEATTSSGNSDAAEAPSIPLDQRARLDELLRSYQRATGIVDHGQLDLECVMCLDTFSEDNPKVRSLCNCGMNRTNFHLSCLLEWLDRDPNCPVCRAYLFYEEQ
ncbi:hypothetical protein ATCC90586_004239 [Pythium insidiosum]|nr:hypothetical protein ATCC90586_004239 [Pythium insidiosum]